MTRSQFGVTEPGTITVEYDAAMSEFAELRVQLPDHFPAEIPDFWRRLNYQLDGIGCQLGLDRNEIHVSLNPGPQGTPAGPGPCDKTLEVDLPEDSVQVM